MNKDLLNRIKRAAKRDKERRRDPRYLATMGFLVAKGFLKTNQPILLQPNRKLRIEDAIWAGQKVEPRILEVLPAATLRLPRHFDLDPVKHAELFAVIRLLRQGEETGNPIWGVPFDRLRVWVHLPLRDRRVKAVTEKKVTRTFRLRPRVVARLQELARELGCSETEALERTISGRQEHERRND